MADLLLNKYIWIILLIAYGACDFFWQVRYGIQKKQKDTKLLKALEFYFETIRPYGQRGFITGGFFIFTGLCILFLENV